MDIPARFLLAAVSLGADFVELLVVPLMAFEATNMIETTVPVVASRKRLDAQINGNDVPTLLVCFLYQVDKGRVVVPACISTDGYLFVACRRGFAEASDDRGIGLVLLATPASVCTRCAALPLLLAVAEREELMPGTHPGEAWRLPIRNPREEGLHALSSRK